MPKKITPDEEYEEEEDDEEDDEDDEEELAPAPQRKPVGRPAVKKRRAPPEPVKRYAAFRQEAAEGIIDVETQEVIAGDLWSAIADMKDQLDRIENAIGVL